MSKVMSRKKRITLTAAVTMTLVIAGAGAAFAFWTATGTGSGSAATGTSVAFTIAQQTASPAPSALTPGGVQTLTFVVTNPGSSAQKLTSIVPAIATTSGAWTVASTSTGNGCSAADYTLGTPNITYGEIPAGGTVTGTVTLTMNDSSTSNQNDCKNATVPVQYGAS